MVAIAARPAAAAAAATRRWNFSLPLMQWPFSFRDADGVRSTGAGRRR